MRWCVENGRLLPYNRPFLTFFTGCLCSIVTIGDERRQSEES